MGRYTPPATAEERARRDAVRAQALQALHSRLREQVRALRTSAGWQAWLAAAARLPAYSARNQLLLLAQRPDATAVAGYHAWQSLGRQVGKGERGLQVLAPVLRRGPAAAGTSTDPGTGDHVTVATADDSTATGRGRPVVAGFRVAHVWDVSQTSGTPLPERPAPVLLAGQAPHGLWDGLTAQLAGRGYTLTRDHQGIGNGRTDFGARTVTVRADLDDAQAAKTLAHELAHVLLHHPDQQHGQGHEGGLPREQAEVEAESVAHLVTAAAGLPSDGYSVPYVAGWAGHSQATSTDDPEAADAADAVLLVTAERVLAAAHTVLAALDHHGPARAAGREQTRDLAARLEQGRERTAGARSSSAEAPARSEVSSAPPGAASPAASAVPAREALLAACADAADLYAAHLAGPSAEAAAARATLAERGVPQDQAVRHRLGVSPQGWTATIDRLRAAGTADEVLLAAGIAATSRRGGLVDRLRGRLVFPIADHEGSVVGFVGRDLGLTGPSAPKYLNTATTALYRKGDVLYGLAAARAALAGGGIPVLVEGPFDLLAVERLGGGWAPIAAVGTAVTPAHAAALAAALPAAGARELVVALDGDTAGKAAALRAWPAIRDAGLWPLHARLPDGLDPAQLAQGDPAALHRRFEEAAPLADAVLDATVAPWRDRLHEVESRVAAARAGARLVTALPPAHAARELARLAQHLGDPRLATTAALEVLERLPPPTALSQATAAPARARGAAPLAGAAPRPRSSRGARS